MKAPTEAYNVASRQIAWKIDIYFDGPFATPVSIERDNFLVSANVLEEAMASSNTPWGSVSANELTVLIRNEEDRFNPSNEDSPYFGKIKTGLKISAFCRPVTNEEYDWDPCGVFYVANWITTAGGLTVEVVAYDQIADVIGSKQVKMRVFRDIPAHMFIREFFSQLRLNPTIDTVTWQTLPFGYHVGDNRDFLNNITAGLNLFIYCDHSGNIVVQYMRKALPVSYTIQDNDQIVDISAQQNLLMDYNGISVIWKKPQLSESIEVLSIKNVHVPMDGLKTEFQLFSNIPVAQLELSKIGVTGLGKILIDRATSVDADYTIKNELGRTFADSLSIVGRVIETVDTEYVSSEGGNLLKLDNIYCQTEEQFNNLRTFLSKFVSSPLPQIEVTVRGNPQFEIGQKIRVLSTRFNMDFKGILIRQQLDYNGGMSGKLVLLNSELLEVG